MNRDQFIEIAKWAAIALLSLFLWLAQDKVNGLQRDIKEVKDENNVQWQTISRQEARLSFIEGYHKHETECKEKKP